jgi:F0F1-type ATP synthase membrane subunit b/b'
MAKSYDLEMAQAGFQQLKTTLESVQTQANTFISTIQNAADENSAKNIKTLVESFETSLKVVMDTLENEVVAKAGEAVDTIAAIAEANG